MNDQAATTRLECAGPRAQQLLPKGEPKIAQPFKAGSCVRSAPSPGGTAELHPMSRHFSPAILSSLPGLFSFVDCIPSVETLGYFLSPSVGILRSSLVTPFFPCPP